MCVCAAIKNALKQENLNPEIEEKLLKMQRYQEQQMKSDDVNVSSANHLAMTATSGSALPIATATNARSQLSNATAAALSAAVSNNHNNHASPSPAKPSGSSRKRTQLRSPLDDDDWVLDTPKRRNVGSSGSNVAAFGAGKTPAHATTAATPTKKSDGISTETSPVTPAPVNKRSLAAKKRESDKKKAALAAQVSSKSNTSTNALSA